MADPKPAWKERAGAFLASSSMRLKAASTALGEAASKASTSVAEAAGGAGAKVKTTWQTSVQPRVSEAASKAGTSMATTWETTKENWNTKVAPRMEAGISTAAKAAADTGSKLRQGLIDTTERVKASKVGQRLGEMTQAGVERSRSLLGRNDWRSKTMQRIDGSNGVTVFGVPLEVVAARAAQQTAPSSSSTSPSTSPHATLASRHPVPSIVTQCCDFILQHGWNTPYLFENEGNSNAVKQLMKGFDQQPDMQIPADTNPLDVAQLLLVYFKCLPEPILTFDLYADFVRLGASGLTGLRPLLHRLPIVNVSALHAILCLLHKISLRAEDNKMDAQSLAAEFAPVLLWRRGEGSSSSSNWPAAPSTRDAAAADAAGGVRHHLTLLHDDNQQQESLMRPVSPPDDFPRAPPEELNGVATPLVIVDVDGNSAPAEIPLEGAQPSQEQTTLVEAVTTLIEQHDVIFSHSPNGPLLLPMDP